ncbi:U1 snRNP protein [Coemansia guatemalensis]|uniref:U1 snRNP protein n=1 Tax=Coemansia guatemalensis TaxID=2761395 RepID=A0A9W8LUK5_9FUNG|nr:U1 snRNP protein [Coemansia guatemalensis]
MEDSRRPSQVGTAMPTPPQTGAAAAPIWAEYTSPDGRTYYFNRATRETRWEKPNELKSPQERDSVWKEYAKDGRPYWYNTETKKSSWTRPDSLGPRPAQPAQKTGQTPSAEQTPSLADQKKATPSEPVSAPGSDSRSPAPPVARQRPDRPERTPAQRSARSRPPVPPPGALEAQKPAKREYKTTEEAEKAFIGMLERHKVGGEWTWEQALRAVVNDPDYRSLKTLPERKNAFHKHISAAREAEREQRKKEQEQRRTDLFALLDTLPISEHTRYRKVKHLAANHAAFTAVPTDAERKRLFSAYMDENLQKLDEERRQLRHQRTKEAAEFLGSVSIGAKWDTTRKQLLEKFEDKMMPILRSDEKERVPMDTLYYFVRDKDSAADPEAGLSMLDLMDVFERAVADAERRETKKRHEEREAVFRRERQNRKAFRQLLKEHNNKFTPSSTWTEFFPLIKHEPRFLAMLGQSGSSPLELFWDEIELLSDEYYRHRKRLESAMREHDFSMQVDTPLDYVRAFAKKHSDVPEEYMDYIYKQLVIKCERRKEEEEERAQRHRRRLLDGLKYALYDLEPPLDPDSEWENEKQRISCLPEFKDVADDAACREIFDLVVERQRERALHKTSRRRDSEARKRSRSPAAAAADSAGGRRTRRRDGEVESEHAAHEDNQQVACSSDLEEGEMVD